MAFKKYSVKNGKKYGPYVYHNERVGEKVVTHYMGKGKTNPLKEKKYLLPWIIFGIFLLVIAVFAFFFHAVSPTGLVLMEIKPQYDLGEKILGVMSFNFKAGELIPADSKVVLSLGSQRKEMALSELISGSLIEGNYYAEQHPFEGNGLGYGALGEKIVYPTLSFELNIRGSDEIPIETPEEQVGEENETIGETTNNETTTETSQTSSEGTETNTEIISETPTTEGLPSAPETPVETPTSSETTSSSASEVSSSSESSSSQSSSDSSRSESSSDSGSSSSDSGSSGGDGGGMTGAFISEDSYTINGQVNYEEEYDYNLEEGQTAVLVPGSVKYNGSVIDDSELEIKIKNGKVVVTTSYTITEKGFGRDYLGDFALSIPVDFDKFDIVAEEGSLNAVLVYNETSLSRNKIDIGINPNETLMNLTVNDTIQVLENISDIRLSSSGRIILNLEEYFQNASNYELVTNNITGVLDGNNLTITADPDFKGVRKAVIIAYNPSGYKVESNEFNILVSSSNIFIVTQQGQVKVGEKVKWIKTVTLEEPEAVAIEIPKKSEDIVVKKVEETSNSDAGFLTGNVVIDMELHKESPLLVWLKSLFNSITGNVVEGVLSESTEIVLDGGALEYEVEYYTDGPTKKEQNSETGKTVIISSNGEFNYTNVLAFTEIPEIYEVGQESMIKVYWEGGKQFMPVDAYDMDGNGKLDYIEWIVPHLSEQRFLIILFDDVTLPTINFEGDTPADSSTINQNNFVVDVTSEDNNVGHYSFVDFNSDLMGWWRGEANANDDSGNSNNAVWSGESKYRVNSGYGGCVYGDCFYFDETADYVDVPSAKIYSNFTLALWFNVTNIGTEAYTDKCLFDQAPHDTFSLYLTNYDADSNLLGHVILKYHVSGDEGHRVNVPLTPDTWNHVAIVSSSDSINLYLNGVLIDTTIISLPEVIGDLRIGGSWAGASWDLAGSVDEFLMFNRSLNGSEILSLYNADVTQYSHNFTSLAEGNYTFKAYAVDASGNKNQTELRTVNYNSSIVEICDNAIDDDSDTFIDCSDSDCFGQTGCTSEAICNDGLDNDADGFGDCLDSDCNGIGICEYSTELTCNDELDNDGDGLTDGADSDCDSTYPLIDYGIGTQANAAVKAQTFVYVNVSVTEPNEANITFTLYNSSLVNTTTYDSAVRVINWTGLALGSYTYNVTVCDDYNQCNTTATRTIILDTGSPRVDYAIGTENNGEILLNPANLVVNISITASSGGLANVTYTLYNSTGVVNSTTYNGEVESITWAVTRAGNYTYQVNTTGLNGVKNNTVIRTIKVLPSCLLITATNCTENFNCTIGEECFLYSASCSAGVCDFINFNMTSAGKLYTGYDSVTGQGLSLVMNISGNNTFASGSKIIFSGKAGSSISPGTAGTNAGVINWTTSGLFNTRYGIFEGVGGKSTLVSTNGGNAGILQINYKGLVGNFSDYDEGRIDCGESGEEDCPDNSPVLTGGLNSLNVVTGTAGSIVYVKSLVCDSRKDADITNDGLVSQNDKQIIENNYNLLLGQDGFNPYWDISCDGKLNVREIARIGFEYNTR